jgi:uncharacterized protein DUF998
MTHPQVVAGVAIGAAAVAIVALAALHVLQRDIDPRRTMISQYALGRFGWVMTVCFAAFAVASASLLIALLGHVPSAVGMVGMFFLFDAAFGLAMAALFRMDPVSTPPAQMSFTGRMHGVAFLIGVPSQVLSVLLLSLALGQQGSHSSATLLALTAVVWLCLALMIVIMVMVGPGKPPNPNGPERFLGFPNRLFMIAYGVWLMAVAWPLLR